MRVGVVLLALDLSPVVRGVPPAGVTLSGLAPASETLSDLVVFGLIRGRLTGRLPLAVPGWLAGGGIGQGAARGQQRQCQTNAGYAGGGGETA
jgi:hypothetical protein